MQKILLYILACFLFSSTCLSQGPSKVLSDDEVNNHLKALIYGGELFGTADKALETLDKNWEEGMIAPLVEVMRFSNNKSQLKAINKLLQRKTDQKHSQFFEWMKWLWDYKPEIKPYYFEFKAEIYDHIDDRFPKYFKNRSDQASIRLEEVVWGGVLQDGIPPLRHPQLLDADKEDYLASTDIVFGAYINGVAKAYPKRILAWHEMFVDYFGDDLICGVYCTLCGTVIAYDTKHEGTTYNLGTSGFLYRSNKLMYDKGTQSLWNTIEGKPVLGPLHDKGIELKVLPIVTTTWGEWKALHPNTKVLSLDTGYDRNYDEGHAYNAYFATDELMFPVPKSDATLSNKDEVLVIRTPAYQIDPIAISIRYLKRKKWYAGQIGDKRFIVLASKSGSARVYDAYDINFKSFKKGRLLDKQNREWAIAHDKLTGPDGSVLERLPSHNTFWFAWFNIYPETRLIK